MGEKLLWDLKVLQWLKNIVYPKTLNIRLDQSVLF